MKAQRIFLALGLALYAGATLGAAPLIVYSARNEQLIRPLFDAWESQGGSHIEFITDKEAPLLARLKSEGANTPADLLITVDAGNLWRAAEDGVLRPIESPVLEANIPAHLRDPRGQWFGLSVRARTIVYNTARVRAGELATYEALATPAFKGRLCLRTSRKVYNQSLVAMMIARHGAAATEQVVRGWVANLATDVFANDTQVLEAVAAGQCDAGIVNTYYFGRLMKKKPQLPLALFWANQGAGGVHVNVSGAGVTRHAKHPVEAQRFLEWLSRPAAQRILADSNLEYPANPAVAPAPAVAAWGRFEQDRTPLAEAGRRQTEAVSLMDRAGYR